MITIKNKKLLAKIDEAKGGDVIQLEFEREHLLDKRGIQGWIKSGKRIDPATGVLGNFFDNIRERAFTVTEHCDNRVTLSINIDGIIIRKQISVSENTLTFNVQVMNESPEISPLMQIEFFNMFAGGRLNERKGKFTAIVNNENEIADILLPENFGQRYVKAYDYKNSKIILADINKNLWTTIATDGEAEKVTCLIQGNIMTRGFNSRKFSLKPGEKFSFSEQITINKGNIFDKIPALRESVTNRLNSQKSNPAQNNSLSSYFSGESVFKHRWIHICLQYDYVNPDDIKKLIDNLFVPLKYTGIVFELDRGVRTYSHPELAESWAMSIETAKSLIDYTRAKGLKVGIEFNSPGHQNETGIEKVYPELLEKGTDKGSTICVSNKKARTIISDVIKELTDTLQPDMFFLGADEAQFEGRATSFGCCDLCRSTGKKPYELFGEYLQWLTDLFKTTQIELAIAGDMFIQSEQFGANVTGNGSAGEVYKALSYLDKSVRIFDWHYYPADKFESLDFFIKNGFDVWPTTAFSFEGIRTFLKYAENLGINGAIHTTWSVPNQEKFVIEPVIWAGFYHWHGQRADTFDVRKIAYEFAQTFW